MENFVKVYLTWGHYIFAHPYTLKISLLNKVESSQFILCLNKSHLLYYLCHLNYLGFLSFFVSNIILLFADWKKYQVNHNYVNLLFHILWIINAFSGIVHHLPNSIGALEVLQLNNGLIKLTNYLEKCKTCIYETYNT